MHFVALDGAQSAGDARLLEREDFIVVNRGIVRGEEPAARVEHWNQSRVQRLFVSRTARKSRVLGTRIIRGPRGSKVRRVAFELGVGDAEDVADVGFDRLGALDL